MFFFFLLLLPLLYPFQNTNTTFQQKSPETQQKSPETPARVKLPPSKVTTKKRGRSFIRTTTVGYDTYIHIYNNFFLWKIMFHVRLKNNNEKKQKNEWSGISGMCFATAVSRVGQNRHQKPLVFIRLQSINKNRAPACDTYKSPPL